MNWNRLGRDASWISLGMLVGGLLVVFLGGCGGSDYSDNNHGYGFEYDVQGVTGIKLRFNPEEPANHRTPLHVFENAWMEVQKCTGLTAPAPMVIVVSRFTVPATTLHIKSDGSSFDGMYFSNPSVIVITHYFVFKHEAIHYLLDMSSGNLDPNHLSKLFITCS